MSDDDLLRRFAALRAPTTSLPDIVPTSHHDIGNGGVPSSAHPHVDTAARRAQQEDQDLARIAHGDFDAAGSTLASRAEGPDEDELLRRRIAALRGVTAEPASTTDNGNDQAIEEYMRSVDVYDEGELNGLATGEDSKSLEREATAALRSTKGLLKATDGTESKDSHDEDEQVETEEEIIARALDEARLDHLSDPVDGSSLESDGAATVHPAADKVHLDSTVQTKADANDDAALSFPSLPSHQPADRDEPEAALDEDTKRRLDMLMGLSPFTAKPGQPKTASGPAPSTYNFPGYGADRDQDADSWCCICNADATIICAGCDDDLYCEECWRDGHGVGDGQERGHKARKFVYGRRQAAAMA
ncbi:hypothetical protein IAU60_001280 [Kwoniella sp. DSM 27419]